MHKSWSEVTAFSQLDREPAWPDTFVHPGYPFCLFFSPSLIYLETNEPSLCALLDPCHWDDKGSFGRGKDLLAPGDAPARPKQNLPVNVSLSDWAVQDTYLPGIRYQDYLQRHVLTEVRQYGDLASRRTKAWLLAFVFFTYSAITHAGPLRK